MKTSKPKKVKKELRAADLMTQPIETVKEHDSIPDVVSLFNESSISAAAVIDSKGQPVGVITKTDLVRYQQERDGRLSRKEIDHAATWMTGVIFTVKPDTSMKEIAGRMVRYGIHHIFVKNPGEKALLGIVSSLDVLRAVAK